MNTVIIVNVHIIDEYSENIVYTNLLQLKKFNLPIMVSANRLSNRIQKLVDHYFISNENLLFKKDYKKYNLVSHYILEPHFSIESRHPYKSPHALSVLSFLYKTVSISKMLNYKYCIIFEWDNIFDDVDIENLKKYYYELINREDKNALVFVYNHELYGPLVQGHSLITFKNEFFLKNFPRVLCEEDYELFLKKLNIDRFLTVEEVLYNCLVEPNKDSVIIYNPDDLKLLGRNTFTNRLVNPMNWPKPSTRTTKKLFCKSDSRNIFYIYSYNNSYINTQCPNFETINYKIKTQSKSHNITHTVNTFCWQLTCPIEILSEEFPIKISVDDCEVIYNSSDDVPNIINFKN